MNFLAHPENAAGQPHLLKDHLRSVGTLAHRFAEAVNPLLAEPAQWAGMLHDLGKYRDEFQAYLREERESSAETHHAVYGAALAFQRHWPGLAFAIAGHHAGLHDLSRLQALVKDEKYKAAERLPLLLERFTAEVGPPGDQFAEPPFDRSQKTRAELYIRLLFSTLVDADFLDTEAHYTGALRPSYELRPDGLLRRLLAEKATKSSAGELNAIRNRIFQQCLDAADRPDWWWQDTCEYGLCASTRREARFAACNYRHPVPINYRAERGAVSTYLGSRQHRHCDRTSFSRRRARRRGRAATLTA
jgi:CRISPR-associated endonuclease/helicase Cas3